MEQKDKYIRFDWAIKRLLHNKANFGVLEGFLTVLLGEEIHILEILESEGNQQREDDKFNRVDIKARNSKDEIILVEVQNTRELYYLERILYGVAKTITEHIDLGEIYSNVKKVYSISILYFDIGQGSDYLYHGQNTFLGVHTGDHLKVTTKEQGAIVRKLPAEIFPEYFPKNRKRQFPASERMGGMPQQRFCRICGKWSPLYSERSGQTDHHHFCGRSPADIPGGSERLRFPDSCESGTL